MFDIQDLDPSQIVDQVPKLITASSFLKLTHPAGKPL